MEFKVEIDAHDILHKFSDEIYDAIAELESDFYDQVQEIINKVNNNNNYEYFVIRIDKDDIQDYNDLSIEEKQLKKIDEKIKFIKEKRDIFFNKIQDAKRKDQNDN